MRLPNYSTDLSPKEITPAQPSSIPQSTTSADSGVRVLLVDDQTIVAYAVRQLISGHPDIEFHVVQHADRVMAEALRWQPTVILQDLVMPDADGFELVRRFREHPQTRNVPVVVLSTKEDPEVKAQAFANGANDYLIKLPAQAEMLARLRYHSAAYMHHLQRDAAYTQLSRELNMARKMLLGLLPQPGNIGPVHFSWFFQASSYVSGDCFDYFSIDERYQCFYVVDVSGHGVSAAMLAFNAQHQIRASGPQAAALIDQHGAIAPAAAAMVTDFNNRFMQMRETSLYLTMVYGILDQETGDVALVQAGHPPALLASRKGRLQPVGDGSLPIGFLSDIQYESHFLKLEAGTRLYLYSDGITDCLNMQEEAFGASRLEQLLSRTSSLTLEEVGGHLHSALCDWQGGIDSFGDDVTFLAIEYRP
ncbi:PP2C family protein-serine/threonine phosphatase [Noviherbaspirillum malthae]|uniref:PP2C family protein-serine/threonine phosphatase n=1 Tax=Noviherbaspirillum malthae TaxID=1260987 RepID=UPI00188F085C|nr:SpoIIE family protein phosphatase [Noviherbaspirillum malthae]